MSLQLNVSLLHTNCMQPECSFSSRTAELADYVFPLVLMADMENNKPSIKFVQGSLERLDRKPYWTPSLLEY